MTERYTTEAWIKRFGDEYGIKTEEVLRQRCRGTPIKGRIYPLPDSWKCFKVGRQWFLYRESSGSVLSADIERIDPRLREDYLNAGIDDFTISQQIAMAREAIATGKPKRLLLQFYPVDLNYKTSNNIAVLPVERVFDEQGNEISTFTPNLDDRLKSADYWHLFLHKQYLMFHLYNNENLTPKQREPYRNGQLKKVIERHIPKQLVQEVEGRLRSHCIWCGCVKGSLGKFCQPVGKSQFKRCKQDFRHWLEELRNMKQIDLNGNEKLDQHKIKIGIDNRMHEIRMALAT